MAEKTLMEQSKWLILIDCDGVLTGYKTFFNSDGKLFKVFNSRDSYAIKKLKASGHTPVIVTSDVEAIDITEARAKSWGVDVFGAKDKLPKVKQVMRDKSFDVVAMVGNSSEDYVCASLLDYFFVPSDARDGYESIDNLVTLSAAGGEGVIEELEKFIRSEVK